MTVIVPAEPLGYLGDAWRRCVGTGRLDLALRADYQESLDIVQRRIGFGHLRGHGLFSDGMGIHRPYDDDGTRRVRHVFTYLDQVIDSWLARQVRPFLELGFMPGGLASGDESVFFWKGNITPPTSYREWADLARATLVHLVDRYGIEEVRRWPIEVWNEPNLASFWKGADREEYLRLYEVTARAVKDVDSGLLVGGPAVSPGADQWWEPFAHFVASRDVPVDFVSRHAYTSGRAQHIPFGVYQTLHDPESLLDQFAAPGRYLAGTALAGLPVHITEYSTSYRPDNPIHDTAYQAAYLAPILAHGGDLVDSFSLWTFCDVFEEQGVPAAIFHGGFGLLTHRQIPKPAFHLFAFMAQAGPHVLARGADHLVTRHDDGRVVILIWQPVRGSEAGRYGSAPATHEVHLDVPVGDEPDAPVAFIRKSVNEEEGNAWTAWRELGRPASPTSRQLDILREAAVPGLRHGELRTNGSRRVQLDLTLQRHEVSVVELIPVSVEHHPGLDDDRLLGHSR